MNTYIDSLNITPFGKSALTTLYETYIETMSEDVLRIYFKSLEDKYKDAKNKNIFFNVKRFSKELDKLRPGNSRNAVLTLPGSVDNSTKGVEKRIKDLEKIVVQLKSQMNEVQSVIADMADRKLITFKLQDIANNGNAEAIMQKSKVYNRLIKQVLETHSIELDILRQFLLGKNSDGDRRVICSTIKMLLLDVDTEILNKFVINTFLQQMNEFNLECQFDEEDFANDHIIFKFKEDCTAVVVNVIGFRRRYNVLKVETSDLASVLRTIISMLLHDLYHLRHFMVDKNYGDDSEESYKEFSTKYILEAQV